MSSTPSPSWHLADQCFRVLRAWNIANGPTAPFHDRMDEIKATIQDEIRRGMAVSQARGGDGLRPAGRAVA